MAPAQDPGSLVLIVLVIVAASVAFWRTVIKIIVVGVMVLVVLGFLELLRIMH